MVDQKHTHDPAARGVAVRQSVLVHAPPERAFAVFTVRMASWWPLETHALGAQPVVDAVIEPRAGGRWYERSADGSERDWGRVLAWEPPHRVVLTWVLTADYAPDPAIRTEVEVRFTAEGEGATRVELEHRGLEAYGARTEEMRTSFGSERGWPGLLRRFSRAVEGD
jgi:uncharacterized protein YndB with AHSA1/START domain